MFCSLKTKLVSEALGDLTSARHPAEDSLLGGGDAEAVGEEFTDADDETRNSFDAVINFANTEPVGVRVLHGFFDLRDDDIRDRTPARFDAFDFNAREREEIDERGNGGREFDEFA